MRRDFALSASFVLECFDGSEVTTREGNELGVQKENCVVEEIKEVELSSRRGKFIYNRTYDFIALNQVVHYIFGITNYHKIEIVIRNSRCFQNLHKSGAAQKYLGYKRFEILYLQNGLAFTCCAISFKTIDQCPWLVEIVSCLFSNDLGWIESTLERLLLGVWKSRNLESGPGN